MNLIRLDFINRIKFFLEINMISKSVGKTTLFIFLALLISNECGFLASAWAQSDHDVFRGYTAINQIIQERVAQDNGFELGQYLDKVSVIPSSGDLLSLLGTYDGSDTSSTFRNGDPNSINMLLWYIALDEFAADIASNCNSVTQNVPSGASGVSPLVLNDDFLAALKPLCAWPDPSAKIDAVLYAFWSALLQYDAPPEEFQAWENFFLNEPAYQNASAASVISDMGLAALYNPYFLLEQ
jgi:hypothetical protein